MQQPLSCICRSLHGRSFHASYKRALSIRTFDKKVLESIITNKKDTDNPGNVNNKNSDADMLKFPLPRPAEVIYGNLMAMQHRLSLWNRFKIRKQLDLDMADLKALQRRWTRPKGAALSFVVTLAVVPGLSGAALPSNRFASLSFRPEDMSANPNELHAMKLLAGPRYCPFTGIIKMSSERFPFQEQNVRFLKDCLSRLLKASKVSSFLQPPKRSIVYIFCCNFLKENPERYVDLPLKHNTFRLKEKFPFPEELKEALQKRAESDECQV